MYATLILLKLYCTNDEYINVDDNIIFLGMSLFVYEFIVVFEYIL